jgi:hypothetical protein
MHACSTTIQAQPYAIEAGISHVRDTMLPALMDIDGCMGLSLLVDRSFGLCIATSAWRDGDAMDAADLSVDSHSADAARRFAGSVEKIERWEIAMLHRKHLVGRGAYVRCTWLQLPLGDLDRAIATSRVHAVPTVEAMDGFSGLSVLLDRATGRAVGTTAWESLGALDGSQRQVAEVRRATSKQTGAQIVMVAEFELAVAHLRLPEIA